MNTSTALVVIDMQRAMFETPGYAPGNGEAVQAAITTLLGAARAAGAPVVFIQHTAAQEGHPFRRGEPGWPLLPFLAQREDEYVVEKHSFDGFLQTSLDATLKKLGAGKLIVCGMQTQFCVDTTCRSAFAHGYEVVLCGDAHTTFDTDVLDAAGITAHHNATLNGRFATVLAASDAAALFGK